MGSLRARHRNLSFSSLNDIALDAEGNILVVDHDSKRVLKVTPDGKTSVFAGTGELKGIQRFERRRRAGNRSSVELPRLASPQARTTRSTSPTAT